MDTTPEDTQQQTYCRPIEQVRETSPFRSIPHRIAPYQQANNIPQQSKQHTFVGRRVNPYTRERKNE